MAYNTSKPTPSPNFGFLAAHDPLLVRYAALAERYVFEDANTALIKLGQLGELLAKKAAAYSGIYLDASDSNVDVLKSLTNRGLLTRETANLFHELRKARNKAAHDGKDDQSEALHQLRMARTLALWFQRSFGKATNFKAGPFVPPPNPKHVESAVAEELQRLREQNAQLAAATEQAQAAATTAEQLRKQAEQQAEQAYSDLKAALELAEESESQAAESIQQYEERLADQQATAVATPAEEIEEVVQQAFEAGGELDLDEADTRRIIDAQLVEAGWQADTKELTYQKGVRPQKGKNLAIAEWHHADGPADYVLFRGLTPLGIVEAKRQNRDVRGSIEQSKRYSRGYTLLPDQKSPGGPWEQYHVPFLFASNGRSYLRQIATKSGIWFLDGRLATNHPRPLDGWYSPEGLHQLLKQDILEADQQLQEQSSQYLPLRPFQHEAVEAVERGIAEGRRQMLLAMATGTGKTRTAIAMIYRLIKANRFRRILFLVDRTALGEQAANAFKDVKLENFQSFNEIYDIKELGDIIPDADTKLQVATIQGMVKRLLYADENSESLPVDLYDCVIVDECHRGYNLDQEMSDAELSFRSEAEYISKYMRVLEHFDAVRIGLTATPALHTTELFGGPDREPIFQYSYRQAVIDGYLVDHEPPFRIRTNLAEEGMHWEVGQEIKVYHSGTRQLELFNTPDEVDIDIEGFNKRVITENFNKVVCTALAEQIDPSLPGKTMVFCATDSHADMVVGLLADAFEQKYGPIDDDTVLKITGAADKPSELIRRYKNEQLPKVAVTVDLLTTGIDVPEITNLVFIRRVRSRILFEQMLGRATRLCPDLYGSREDKERFLIYDAVDIYSALEDHTNMQPVVTKPNISFVQLVEELARVRDEDIRADLQSQVVSKLQRKSNKITGERGEQLETLLETDVRSFITQLRANTPQQASDWFAEHPNVAEFLDTMTRTGGSSLIVSEHEDELISMEQGYGEAGRPADYLESFRQYIQENMDQIDALQVVCQRPRDLTRQQLKELKLELDRHQFNEMSLRTAVRETTNQDIAASIIGYIRHVILGSQLVPYQERVSQAINTVLANHNWNQPQRKWLQRIGKQLEQETVVDREALEHGEFKAQGGFARLNKVFGGRLEELLAEISDAIWQVAA